MKRMAIVAALAACSGHAAAAPEESTIESSRALDQLVKSTSVSTTTPLPNTCGAAPLPLTPQGPVVHTSLTYGTRAPVDVVAWRYPCSASDSMIVLTLTPTNSQSPSFICAPRFQLLQAGGLQTTAFSVKNDPVPISSYCAEVVAPVTVAFVPTTQTPASFDFDQGMSVNYDGLSAGQQYIAIPAYNPALYNLTPPLGSNAVKVHVRGSATSYRNCAVSITAIGGGSEYTASCNDEAPLKAGGFELYDY
ncbi:MAG: hypothetical protein ABIV12_16295 [Dokdonella sp.]